MYHFKLSRSGTLYWTRDLEDVVWAAMGANPIGVWCCVDATYGQGLTSAQKRAVPLVEQHVFDLLGRAVTVSGHGLLTAYGNSTECPGPELIGYLANGRRW